MEAFYKRIPVVAYAATAVPATLDGGGVLYTDRDPFHVAAVIDAIVSNNDLQELILARQDEALDRLRARDFGGTLLRFVDQVAQAPALSAPRVTWDFWDQMDSLDRLEELRELRPAAYFALPQAPR
jgi:hypothetical protein